MRAFLSTDNRPRRHIARYAMHCLIMGPTVDSWEASARAETKDREASEREARAILAETEPEPYCYPAGALEMHAHTWDFYPHGHGLKETRSALAEALAAFLES